MLLVIALAVPASMLAQQSSNAEQQIKKLIDQGTAATLKGDTNFFEKILADDYTAIRGDGSVLTKAQLIERYKSGSIKYETLELKDVKIRVYGHTAISTTLGFSKNIRDGQPHSVTTRTTVVWVKQKGNWKSVSYQTTRVLQ